MTYYNVKPKMLVLLQTVAPTNQQSFTLEQGFSTFFCDPIFKNKFLCDFNMCNANFFIWKTTHVLEKPCNKNEKLK